MMKFKDFYKGQRSFCSEDSISQTIKNSKKFNPSVESPESASRVQLLDTSKQKTYLVATSKNIYKIIDDRRSDKPKIAWSRSRSKIAPNNKLNVRIEPYKSRTDKLVIEALPEKSNLVSKNLFTNIGIAEAIEDLLK